MTPSRHPATREPAKGHVLIGNVFDDEDAAMGGGGRSYGGSAAKKSGGAVKKGSPAKKSGGAAKKSGGAAKKSESSNHFGNRAGRGAADVGRAVGPGVSQSRAG